MLPSARLQAQCTRGAWTAEAFTGSAWHLPIPLVVDLPEEHARLRARYNTRPFADAPYYSYRLGHTWTSGRAVEVEMLHHKLYLENPRPPVERFEVTHGYNLPTVNVVWPASGWQLRFGLGLVVAHPEGRIAGRAVSGGRTLLGGGYHIAGVTAQVAFGRRYVLWGSRVAMTAAPEVKLTASWARIPLQRGHLSVPDVSLHALGGLGVRFCQ
jgi:hypothetical protein